MYGEHILPNNVHGGFNGKNIRGAQQISTELVNKAICSGQQQQDSGGQPHGPFDIPGDDQKQPIDNGGAEIVHDHPVVADVQVAGVGNHFGRQSAGKENAGQSPQSVQQKAAGRMLRLKLDKTRRRKQRGENQTVFPGIENAAKQQNHAANGGAPNAAPFVQPQKAGFAQGIHCRISLSYCDITHKFTTSTAKKQPDNPGCSWKVSKKRPASEKKAGRARRKRRIKTPPRFCKRSRYGWGRTAAPTKSAAPSG